MSSRMLRKLLGLAVSRRTDVALCLHDMRDAKGPTPDVCDMRDVVRDQRGQRNDKGRIPRCCVLERAVLTGGYQPYVRL